ncbi:MAG: SulP family inorganic anion transporter [Gammaproteobacteria bacterium]
MRRLLASVPERWLRILLPSLRWRSRVNRTTLKLDLIAGLTGAALMLPQGVAFATIAGMPPQYGLYAGMIPAIIAALFGSSWHLVSGPTTAASVVLFSALSPHALPGSAEYIQLALTLTLMVGLFQLAMGLARMGALVNFISHTVVIGFTAGAALLIAVSQLPHLLGVAIARGGYTYETLLRIGERLPDSNVYTLAVGIVTLLSGLLSKRYWSGGTLYADRYGDRQCFCPGAGQYRRQRHYRHQYGWRTACHAATTIGTTKYLSALSKHWHRQR